MNKIYEEASLMEEAKQSKYLARIEKYESIESVQRSVDEDLLDIIVFCKWSLERLRKL
jgi:hypothetical protein